MPTSYIRRTRHRQEGHDRIRFNKKVWIDPVFGIQGSSIEKMCVAEFIRRGIYFVHTPQSNGLGGFVDPTWEPDFQIPQYKIWIEIQGAYFHTLPGAPERDALRFAIIQAAGWRPYYWWEDDIRTRLPWLMDQVPEFYHVDVAKNADLIKRLHTPGLPYGEPAANIDHLKGLRKALRARARPPQGLKVKRHTHRKRK